MEKMKGKNKASIPIIILMIYIVYYYLVLKFIIEKDKLISLNDINISNIGTKFIGDSLLMLLFPVIIILIYRERLIEFKLQFKHSYLQYALISIMIILFFIHSDFSVKGFYKLFFYLVVVGFGEEFIFRGYVYNELLKTNKLLAIIVSGFLHGIMHGILPGLLVRNIIGQMLSWIGGGIAIGYYFIYLLEKSKSIFIPVFVHAILNYSVGYIGFFTAVCTAIYLFVTDKKNQSAHHSLVRRMKDTSDRYRG